MVTYLQFEIVSAILFALLLCILVITQRKRVIVDKFLFPLFYLVRWRTQFGVAVMERYGKKYRGFIQFCGYASIGIALLGIIWIFASLIYGLYLSLTTPEGVASVSLVLPFTEVPGLGMLGFWHWIISIFILAVVHELSHGIVAASHQVPIKNSGPAIFGILLPFLPAAYVEPDEEQMQKKPAVVRYSIIAAGPVSNIVLGVLVLLILLFVFVPLERRMTEPLGFSFVAVNASTPAGLVLRTERVVFDHVDSISVLNATAFYNKIRIKQPGDTILLSNSKTTTRANITLGTNPEDASLPYLGVINIQDERRFYNEQQGKVFSWFRNLVKWLAALNIFIGIANLLPLGPVDGGQFLKVFLHEIFPVNEKRAQKWWLRISFITLILIILGFLGPSLF